MTNAFTAKEKAAIDAAFNAMSRAIDSHSTTMIHRTSDAIKAWKRDCKDAPHTAKALAVHYFNTGLSGRVLSPDALWLMRQEAVTYYLAGAAMANSSTIAAARLEYGGFGPPWPELAANASAAHNAFIARY